MKTRKSIPMFLGIVLFTTFTISCSMDSKFDIAELTQDITSNRSIQMGTGISAEDFLTVSGRDLVNTNGEVVVLKGVNLGGWMIQENWMCPIEGEDRGWANLDTIEAFEAQGFSQAEIQTLFDTYQDNWITEDDLDYIADTGCNVIRVPFWYRNFMLDTDGTWIDSDLDENPGFQRLDWIIEEAGSRGMYVILDLHGAPGGQSMDHCCGTLEQNDLYTDQTCQDTTVKLWKAIASRYSDNPVVAFYDALNEPQNNSGYSGDHAYDPWLESTWDLTNGIYDLLVDAIRSVDTEHPIAVEGIWRITNLPDPAEYGWENMVYSVHLYDGTSDFTTLLDAAVTLCEDYGVGLYVGEFSNIEGIQLCADRGVSYTTWTYKLAEPNGDWGWFAKSCTGVDSENDSYDSILTTWGSVIQTSNDFVANTTFIDAVKEGVETGSSYVAPEPTIIPGTIEAEDYSSMSGIESETTEDVNGSQNIGWIDNGDWTKYLIDVETAGTYRVDIRVAADDSTETKSIEFLSGDDVLGSVEFDATGGWQEWTTVATTIDLEQGEQTLTVSYGCDGLNVNWLDFTLYSGDDLDSPTTPGDLNVTTTTSSASLSWTASTDNTGVAGYMVSIDGGSEVEVSGTSYTFIGLSQNTTYTLKVVAVDAAGNRSSAAYVDSTTGKDADSFPLLIEAEDYVDMSGIQTQDCSEGTLNVGWTDSSDWLEYTINNSTAGSFTVEYRLAGNGGEIELLSNDSLLDSFDIPATTGWQDWSTVERTVYLPAGMQTLRINILSGGFNLNWINLASTIDDAGNQSAESNTSASTSTVSDDDYELLLEAENYYTMSGIQTADCDEGGEYVGWIDSSDWFDFNIDVPETGTYTIKYRLASENSDGHFRFDTDQGNTVLDDVYVSSTGGWQEWVTVTSSVELTEGEMTVGVFAFNGGFNVNWIEISK